MHKELGRVLATAAVIGSPLLLEGCQPQTVGQPQNSERATATAPKPTATIFPIGGGSVDGKNDASYPQVSDSVARAVLIGRDQGTPPSEPTIIALNPLLEADRNRAATAQAQPSPTFTEIATSTPTTKPLIPTEVPKTPIPESPIASRDIYSATFGSSGKMIFTLLPSGEILISSYSLDNTCTDPNRLPFSFTRVINGADVKKSGQQLEFSILGTKTVTLTATGEKLVGTFTEKGYSIPVNNVVVICKGATYSLEAFKTGQGPADYIRGFRGIFQAPYPTGTTDSKVQTDIEKQSGSGRKLSELFGE